MAEHFTDAEYDNFYEASKRDAQFVGSEIRQFIGDLRKARAERDGLKNALKPLAVLEVPKGAKYNAGTYSIRFSDIERAKQVLTPPDTGAIARGGE